MQGEQCLGVAPQALFGTGYFVALFASRDPFITSNGRTK
jgi:hypothetical protein